MTLIKHCAITLRRTTRPATLAVTRCHRTFSTTRLVAARAKTPADRHKRFEEAVNNPAYRKLLDNAQAMQALDEIQRIMQEKAVDPIKGPTALQMFELYKSSSFRGAVRALKEEFDRTGIDLADTDLAQAWRTVSRTTRDE